MPTEDRPLPGLTDRLRLDKWLWAARFYKTRGLAADDIDKGRIQVNEQVAKASRELKAGDWITIDGGSGKVYAGKAELQAPVLSAEFTRLMEWADKKRHLKVRVDADTGRASHVERICLRRQAEGGEDD